MFKKIGLVLGVMLSVITPPSYAENEIFYNFDGDQNSSGPDTFRIFAKSKGTVRLSPDFRYSGYFSAQIRDMSGDGDFPELQGYFPLQERGHVYFQFAILFTNTREEFNIALAGPQWFGLKKDGIGFWLKSENGVMQHVTGGDTKTLFELEKLRWYSVSVKYDIAAGTYDLDILSEGDSEPRVALKSVMNAPGVMGSRLQMFSFIGDLADKSNVAYYIDDVRISLSETALPPLVAPGRRKLFIDYWTELNRTLRSRPQCMPFLFVDDLGLDVTETRRRYGNKGVESLLTLATTREVKSLNLGEASADPQLKAVLEWRLGCDALDAADYPRALDKFERSLEILPHGKLIKLSKVMALEGLRRLDEADSLLAAIYVQWVYDERFASAQAMIGLARGNMIDAENVLHRTLANASNDSTAAALWLHGPSSEWIVEAKRQQSENWHRYLRDYFLNQQYYFVLIWRQKYIEAMTYAESVTRALQQKKYPVALWFEYQGSAALFAKRYDLAERYYYQAMADQLTLMQSTSSVVLKLSDLYFLTGDMQRERWFRETVYGRLLQN